VAAARRYSAVKHRTENLSTSMKVTVLYPAPNRSNVRRSMFSCSLLSTNVVFASRRKSRVRGQGGRAACSGLCRDWELFNTVIGPPL